MLVSLSALGTARPSLAQSVSGQGKGIVGGTLLGAELAILGEAIAGVEQPWLYWVGSGAGAALGGVGGYYLEQSASPRLSAVSLVLGMAFSIPGFVVYLDATNEARLGIPSDYDGPHWQDEPPPLTGGAGHSAPAAVAFSLLSDDEGWHVGVPNVEVEQVFSRAEVAAWGAPTGQRILVNVLAARF